MHSATMLLFIVVCSNRPVARGGRGGRPTPPFSHEVRVSRALYYSSRLPHQRRALKCSACTQARPCEGGVARQCWPCWAKNDPPIVETWLRAWVIIMFCLFVCGSSYVYISKKLLILTVGWERVSWALWPAGGLWIQLGWCSGNYASPLWSR